MGGSFFAGDIRQGRIQVNFLGESRAKPELRAQSARELRAKPEPRAKPKKKRGRGLGRGLGEPLPRNFLKIWTWNRAIWCRYLKSIPVYMSIPEAKILVGNTSSLKEGFDWRIRARWKRGSMSLKGGSIEPLEPPLNMGLSLGLVVSAQVLAVRHDISV